MSRTYRPSIGSISSDTLATDDLLEAFAGELCMFPEHEAFAREAMAAADDLSLDHDALEPLLSEAFERLKSVALDGMRFGAAEGDGACFGFWPDSDAIDEMPAIDDCDPDAARAMGETCKFVNCHGNVTVYAADGARLWDCV